MNDGLVIEDHKNNSMLIIEHKQEECYSINMEDCSSFFQASFTNKINSNNVSTIEPQMNSMEDISHEEDELFEEKYDSVVINNVEIDQQESDKFKNFSGKDLFSPLPIEKLFQPIPSGSKESTIISAPEDDKEMSQIIPGDSQSLLMIKNQINGVCKPPQKLFQSGYDTQTRTRLSQLVSELDERQVPEYTYVKVEAKVDDDDSNDECITMKKLKLSEPLEVAPVKLIYPSSSRPNSTSAVTKATEVPQPTKPQEPSTATTKNLVTVTNSFDYSNYNYDYDPINTMEAVSVTVNQIDELSLSLQEYRTRKQDDIHRFKPILYDVEEEAEEIEDQITTKEIDLSGCSLHSSLLLFKIISTYLSKDFHVVKLDLSNNQLTNLNFMINMSQTSLLNSLTELDLKNNSLSSLEEVLNSLRSFKKVLKKLDLRWNPLNSKFQDFYELGYQNSSDSDVIRYISYKYCVIVQFDFAELQCIDGEVIREPKQIIKEELKKMYQIIKSNCRSQLFKKQGNIQKTKEKSERFWIPLKE